MIFPLQWMFYNLFYSILLLVLLDNIVQITKICYITDTNMEPTQGAIKVWLSVQWKKKDPKSNFEQWLVSPISTDLAVC